MRIRQMGFSSRLKAHRNLLTLETLKFLVGYLDHGKATLAALESGIPETYATRQGQWLKKLPMVRKAMEREIDAGDLRKLKSKVEQIDRLMEDCKALLSLDDLDHTPEP